MEPARREKHPPSQNVRARRGPRRQIPRLRRGHVTVSSVLRSVRIAKRAIDVAGGLLGLAVSAPLMPIIAAAIYIDSPGPVLFRQRRAGSLRAVKTENGKKQFQFDEFEMHKFRTM